MEPVFVVVLVLCFVTVGLFMIAGGVFGKEEKNETYYESRRREMRERRWRK